ncbi:MAG: OmpH family outer membrane protein [Bacteroidota bacterium]
MKKTLLILVGTLLLSISSFAQKYAYVDTDYILSNIPEYKDAQDDLDKTSILWQKEIEKKFGEIDKMYKSFQSESTLLPEEMKKKREDEIVKAEKEAKDLQKKRFGSGGDLAKKRAELIKPIQDKVYNAIEEMATSKNYAFIFDRAGSLSILYADTKLDISDDILTRLGYTPSSKKDSKSIIKTNSKDSNEKPSGGGDEDTKKVIRK